MLILTYEVGNSQIKTEFPSRNIQFLPTAFYNVYNAAVTPALRIQPGDTISTESLDALGFDKDSVKRGERGNPLTGPFYIDGATAARIGHDSALQYLLTRLGVAM